MILPFVWKYSRLIITLTFQSIRNFSLSVFQHHHGTELYLDIAKHDFHKTLSQIDIQRKLYNTTHFDIQQQRSQLLIKHHRVLWVSCYVFSTAAASVRDSFTILFMRYLLIYLRDSCETKHELWHQAVAHELMLWPNSGITFTSNIFSNSFFNLAKYLVHSVGLTRNISRMVCLIGPMILILCFQGQVINLSCIEMPVATDTTVTNLKSATLDSR